MGGLIIVSILVLGGFLMAATKNRDASVYGMEDDPVSIENIRSGVANRWYTCVLTRVNNIPAVRLSGRTTDGKIYTDVFTVTEEDWQTLKNEGYKVVEQ